jgi:hypothetical protein
MFNLKPAFTWLFLFSPYQSKIFSWEGINKTFYEKLEICGLYYKPITIVNDTYEKTLVAQNNSDLLLKNRMHNMSSL